MSLGMGLDFLLNCLAGKIDVKQEVYYFNESHVGLVCHHILKELVEDQLAINRLARDQTIHDLCDQIQDVLVEINQHFIPQVHVVPVNHLVIFPDPVAKEPLVLVEEKNELDQELE